MILAIMTTVCLSAVFLLGYQAAKYSDEEEVYTLKQSLRNRGIEDKY